ncbi:MAG TPA: hypothetical protein VFT22_18195 [Kofleriaceae bacterium]|nr:hypothetical protein [Kofleriaceae bacterium]
MGRAKTDLMETTIGQLVATLFAAYDRRFHDEDLAAVATQVRIAELFEDRSLRAGRRRRRA